MMRGDAPWSAGSVVAPARYTHPNIVFLRQRVLEHVLTHRRLRWQILLVLTTSQAVFRCAVRKGCRTMGYQRCVDAFAATARRTNHLKLCLAGPLRDGLRTRTLVPLAPDSRSV